MEGNIRALKTDAEPKALALSKNESKCIAPSIASHLTSCFHGSGIFEFDADFGFAYPTQNRILQVGFRVGCHGICSTWWHQQFMVNVGKIKCVRFVEQCRVLEAYAAIAQAFSNRAFVFKRVGKPPMNKSALPQILFRKRT